MVQPIIAGLVTCRPSNSWQRNFRRRGVPTATWAVPQWRGGREKWWDGVAWVRLDHVVDYIHAYRSQMLHIWNIYLQNWVIFGVNVGKYSVHGAFGDSQWEKFTILRYPKQQKGDIYIYTKIYFCGPFHSYNWLADPIYAIHKQWVAGVTSHL